MSILFSGRHQTQSDPIATTMCRIPFLCAMAAFPFFSMASPVESADTLGELSFEAGGETTRWQIISREVRGRIRNSATLSKGDLFDQFEITAYAVEPNSNERFNISLVFGRPIGAPTAVNYDRPTDVSIVRLLGGITGPLWEARDIEIKYSLEMASEEEGRANGEFTATFCYQDSLYDDPVESTCAPGAGTFETRFAIENDE